MGLRRGEASQRERVQHLALALQIVLKPTATHRPIIGERDRERIEIIAFGINGQMNQDMRTALAAVGGVEPILETRANGARFHRAWIVNPLSGNEMDAIKNIARTDDEAEAAARPEPAP